MMSSKQIKIVVGTGIVTLAGWIFAEAKLDPSTIGYLILIWIPLVVGCGWAFLAKD